MAAIDISALPEITLPSEIAKCFLLLYVDADATGDPVLDVISASKLLHLRKMTRPADLPLPSTLSYIGAPVIAGVPEVGVVLTIAGFAAVGGTVPYTITYEWFIDAVSVATAPTYTPISADATKTLTARVAIADSAVAQITTALTPGVVITSADSLVLVGAPVLDLSPVNGLVKGIGDSIDITPATFTASSTPTETHQWLDNDTDAVLVDLGEVTAPTSYVLPVGFLGKNVALETTATVGAIVVVTRSNAVAIAYGPELFVHPFSANGGWDGTYNAASGYLGAAQYVLQRDAVYGGSTDTIRASLTGLTAGNYELYALTAPGGDFGSMDYRISVAGPGQIASGITYGTSFVAYPFSNPNASATIDFIPNAPNRSANITISLRKKVL